MNILFNCSTNVVGGGVKNSALFVAHVMEDRSVNWFFALSPQVKALLDDWGFPVSGAFVCKSSPARSVRARWYLKELENKLSIDCVFTMAGPSYVNFSSIHVQGISNPHITHSNLSDIKAVMGKKDLVRYLIHTAYQRRKSRNADYFIFQTESSRSGFCRQTNVANERTLVIPNATDFSSFNINREPFLGVSKKIDILCPAASYPHKALEFIPEYAVELKALGLDNFRFLLTIAKESKPYQSIKRKALSLGVGYEVDTIGPYSYRDVENIYRTSDFVFVPSLLETFSATYLEAFTSCRPLIVADREFARDVCQNAALYVEPLDSVHVANNIFDLARCPELQSRLVNEGVGVIERCDDQKVRTKKILKFLLEVAQKGKNV